MKSLKEKISITLDSNVIHRIKELAEHEDRSFSQFVNLVLKKYINYIDENIEEKDSN